MSDKVYGVSYRSELDGLRCLGVALVLISHLPLITDAPLWNLLKELAGALRAGYLGVDIFFVLSGFLITRILLSERTLPRRWVIQTFFIKRALRIFPIFYLTVVYCWLVVDLPDNEILANTLYVSNYYYSFVDDASPLRHTWSLAVEEQFYLFWPLVILLMPLVRLNLVIILTAVGLVATSMILAYLLLPSETVKLISVRGTTFRILSLAAGALMALHLDRILLFRAWPLLILALLIFPALQAAIRTWNGVGTELILLPVFSAWSVSIFLSVLLCSRSNNLVSTIFKARLPVYIGKISYGIYLYHLVVLHQMNLRDGYREGGVALWEVAIAIGVTLGIAMLSFHLIESRLLRLKHRFKTPKAC